MKPMTSNYLSVHIFYNVADLRAILLECVEPLVRRLQGAGMLERYFVIRYWEGGAHVRLRLLPKAHVSHDDLKAAAAPTIERFLEGRPSLFDPDPEVMAPLMRLLYVMEYGEEAYERIYGATGTIPLQPNNSFAYIPYVPEYARYGGMHGMQVSERHFEEASDVALEVLRDTGSTLRTMTLGAAFQLMLHFALAFFGERAQVVRFFRGYARFFQGVGTELEVQVAFDQVFARQAERIREQCSQLEAINARLVEGGMGALGRHAREARRLRAELYPLYEGGLLEFSEPAASFETAGTRLLTSYVHMMNNRLGVLIVEEVYMANMIVRALEDAP